MSVELVVTADEDLAHLTTLVRYDRRPGGWLWRPLSAVHRAPAPGLLRDADARLEGQRTTRWWTNTTPVDPRGRVSTRSRSTRRPSWGNNGMPPPTSTG